jgi:hypothetical protein
MKKERKTIFINLRSSDNTGGAVQTASIPRSCDKKRGRKTPKAGTGTAGQGMFTFGRELPQTRAVSARATYAASFVTRECAVSRVCDPTIRICCQS